MAGISISISHGVEGTAPSDFTVGTSTPGAGDIEVRWNTTDTNSNTLTKKDVVLGLMALIRAVEDEQVPITNSPPL